MTWLCLVALLHTQTVAPVCVAVTRTRDACLVQASQFNSNSPIAERPPVARTKRDHAYVCLSLVYPT